MSERKKKRIVLYWVREFKSDAPRLCTSKEYHDFAEVATAESLTADALAEMLDQDAEGDNYHHIVGAHVELVKILRRAATEEVAIEVMRTIADGGGIHHMANH